MKRRAPIFNICFLGVLTVLTGAQVAAQQIDWVQQIGSHKTTGATRIVTDHEGHLYVLGPFEDTVFFTPRFQAADTLISGSTRNNSLFLAKFDTAGRLIWHKDITGQDYVNQQHDLALDPSGNLFVAGGFTGTMEFQTLTGTVSFSTQVHPTFPNPVEGFVCKLNSSGDYIWAKKNRGRIKRIFAHPAYGGSIG